MLEPLILRAAQPADIAAVCELYLAARKRFLPYAPLAHSDAEVFAWMRDVLAVQAELTVALHGERIVGMLAVSRAGGVGWIDQLYVHPDAVGQGIGARLLAPAMKRLGAPIRLYTFQQNGGARRFYERHGFAPLAFGDGSANEEGCPDVLYEWRGPAYVIIIREGYSRFDLRPVRLPQRTPDVTQTLLPNAAARARQSPPARSSA